MSLIIATGSNQGDRKQFLEEALAHLSDHYELVAKSRIYLSEAVDYLNQPDFYNQVLEFRIPDQSAMDVLRQCLQIEIKMGRRRDIPKGPRTIDIDIIFWGIQSFDRPGLSVPHPSWSKRSFIVYPLQELPYFKTLQNHYRIPSTFNNSANPL